MKSKIVFSVLIISLICVAIFFSLKNQDNNTNNASENIDKNIEEIKNEVGITGNNELYEVITEYNGNKVLNVKDDIQYKIAFAGIIKKSIPNLDEIDEVFEKNYPKKVGVWIEQTSRAKFEKILKECVNNEYKISDEGYLQIEKENNPNDMDKKLKKIINGNTNYVIAISELYYKADEVTGKIVDNFYEELDPYQTGKVIDIPNNKIVILTTNSENKLSNKEILNTLIMN